MENQVRDDSKLTLAKKLLAIGQEIGYIQKDATNEFQRYRYASERAIKEAVYPKLAENGIIFWLDAIPDATQHFKTLKDDGSEGATLVCYFTFHFLDVETGAEITGKMVGSGRGGDDKGAYIACTGAIKYTLTTFLGIVTGDDAERDMPVGGGGAPQHQPQPQRSQSPPPGAQPVDLMCGACGDSFTLADVKVFQAKFPDKKRKRWDVGENLFYCPRCPEGTKTVDAVRIAAARFQSS